MKRKIRQKGPASAQLYTIYTFYTAKETTNYQLPTIN